VRPYPRSRPDERHVTESYADASSCMHATERVGQLKSSEQLDRPPKMPS